MKKAAAGAKGGIKGNPWRETYASNGALVDARLNKNECFIMVKWDVENINSADIFFNMAINLNPL